MFEVAPITTYDDACEALMMTLVNPQERRMTALDHYMKYVDSGHKTPWPDTRSGTKGESP